MSSLKVRFGALAIGGGLAAFILAGAPALASTHHPATSVTGPEVVAGALHGAPALASNPIVPVQLGGLIASHGTLSLGSSKSKTHTVTTAAGNLVVHGTGTPTKSQSENAKTCQESFTNDLTFSVLGSKSTGSFAGTSGPGAAQIYFTAFAPRYTSGAKKGQCNFNGQPKAKGAEATFLASIVLTTGG
jgi:hypothetical protein